MARYFIIGSGNRQDIESTVNEVLVEKNLVKRRGRSWKRATWWREVLKFASEKVGRPIYGSFDLNQDWDCLISYSDDDRWVFADLRIQDKKPSRRGVASGLEPVMGNFQITLAPKGYGSAVETGAEFQATRLDELCEALRPKFPKAYVFRAYGVGGSDIRPVE